MSLFHHREELLKAGPLEVLARPSGVLDDGHGSEVVELRIGPELLGLSVDRETLGRLLLGRDPAVCDVQHRSVTSAQLAGRSGARSSRGPTPRGPDRDLGLGSSPLRPTSRGRAGRATLPEHCFASHAIRRAYCRRAPGRRCVKEHVGAAAPGIGAWSRRGRCDGGDRHR